MFPLERVEVLAPRAALLGTADKLTNDTVARILARPEVKSVIPRMALAFPATGALVLGNSQPFRIEVIGDGIDPSYAEERFHGDFKDWEAPELTRDLLACTAQTGYRCSGPYYCDQRDLRCHHKVPVLMSRYLLEIYNSQIADSRGMRHIGEIPANTGLPTMVHLRVRLGDTMVGAANKNLRAGPRDIDTIILGLSDRAIGLGGTVPIGYVKQWNSEFVGEEAANEYSSIIVELRDKNEAAVFGAWVQKELGLQLEDSLGEKFAWVILIVTGFFLLISLVIILISAINIAHNFFMQVSERRREIGIMRAVGATESDVRAIILGEAALIGMVAGALGVVLAVLGGAGVDALFSRALPDFPFKPKTYFDFRTWILLGGLGFSVVFCILGGYLPARRASRMQPAQALAAQ
jgi:hypothetical protein